LDDEVNVGGGGDGDVVEQRGEEEVGEQ